MLVLDNLSMTSKDISLSSEMGKSRMEDLECVGKSICCCNPKL